VRRSILQTTSSPVHLGILGGSNATINFPGPITITGDSMVLSLELLVSQSVTLSSCYNPTVSTPMDLPQSSTLTPLTLSPEPTNPKNGKLSGVHGEVATLDAGIIASQSRCRSRRAGDAVDCSQWRDGLSGPHDFSALAVEHSSIWTSRFNPTARCSPRVVAVEDPGATNVLTGPLIYVVASVTDITWCHPGNWRELFESRSIWWLSFNYGSAVFQISGSSRTCKRFPSRPVLPRRTWSRDRMSMFLPQHCRRGPVR